MITITLHPPRSPMGSVSLSQLLTFPFSYASATHAGIEITAPERLERQDLKMIGAGNQKN
jgi:hypothetical protein